MKSIDQFLWCPLFYIFRRTRVDRRTLARQARDEDEEVEEEEEQNAHVTVIV